MLPLLKTLLLVLGLVVFGTTTALVGYDIYLAVQLNRLLPPRKQFRRS